MKRSFLKEECATASYTGGAWLSSARVVRCWVKSRNERNPCFQLIGSPILKRLSVINRGKVRTTSSQHAPYILGYTRATLGQDNEIQFREKKSIYKPTLSSDCRLQLAYMKLESLVIAGQLHSGEFVPGPCTHRPSHHGSWLHPKSLF